LPSHRDLRLQACRHHGVNTLLNPEVKPCWDLYIELYTKISFLGKIFRHRH
ncbi:unnamed protein product, partial [Musa acuminata subsp. malaccensis]